MHIFQPSLSNRLNPHFFVAGKLGNVPGFNEEGKEDLKRWEQNQHKKDLSKSFLANPRKK